MERTSPFGWLISHNSFCEVSHRCVHLQKPVGKRNSMNNVIENNYSNPPSARNRLRMVYQYHLEPAVTIQMPDNAGALRSKTEKHFHLVCVLVFLEDVLAVDHYLDPLDRFVHWPNINLSGKSIPEHPNPHDHNGMQLKHYQILFWFQHNLDLSEQLHLWKYFVVYDCSMLCYAMKGMELTYGIHVGNMINKITFSQVYCDFPVRCTFLKYSV